MRIALHVNASGADSFFGLKYNKKCYNFKAQPLVIKQIFLKRATLTSFYSRHK